MAFCGNITRYRGVLLRRCGRDNTGRGELIAVETASFVHSERLNRDSAQLCASIAAMKTRFCRKRRETTLTTCLHVKEFACFHLLLMYIYLSVFISNKISRFFNINLTFMKCIIFTSELKLRGFHRNMLASYFYSCCSMIAK